MKNYPIYLKKILTGNIVLAYAMVLSKNESIYVSNTSNQIEENVLNDDFYRYERGFISSNKQEFDDAFVNVQHSLLIKAGSLEKLKSA